MCTEFCYFNTECDLLQAGYRLSLLILIHNISYITHGLKGKRSFLRATRVVVSPFQVLIGIYFVLSRIFSVYDAVKLVPLFPVGEYTKTLFLHFSYFYLYSLPNTHLGSTKLPIKIDILKLLISSIEGANRKRIVFWTYNNGRF